MFHFISIGNENITAFSTKGERIKVQTKCFIMYYLTFVIKYFITGKAKFPTDLDYIVKIVPTFQSGL